MHTLTKPFLTLTAQDLMSRELVLLPQELSLRSAARWLDQDHVSGAPVVDEEGRCVGVLSATDFLRRAEQEGASEPLRCNLNHAAVFHGWQMVDLEVLPNDQVRNYMTPDPITAPPTTSIVELARMMLDAHIHRIVVVDQERRPIGVVSTTDLLAALAHTDQNSLEKLETVWPVAY
jgi:CBS-domain-containing membrane protein